MSAPLMVMAAAGNSSVVLPPDGTLWMAQLHSPLISQGSAYDNTLGVDANANGVYLTGQVSEGGVADFSVLKYNSTGMLLWQERSVAFSSINLRGQAIAVDSSGNSYSAGWYDNGTNNDVLILKLNTSGAVTWFRKLTGSNYDAAYGIGLDGSGNVFTTGYTYNSAGTIASSFLTKHNSAGTLQWQRTLTPASGAAQGNAVVTDGTGNAYVCGGTYVGIDKGFVAKYNTSGTIQWQRTITSSGSTTFYGMAIDSSANLYVGGYQGNTSGPILMKYDSNGVLQWQRTFGSGSIRGVAVDNLGYVYTVDNGGIIAQWDTSGTLQWQRNLKFGGSNVSLQGIRCYGGALYLAGTVSITGSNAMAIRLPADGSGQGTYGLFTYTSSSLTASTGAATEAAGAATEAAGSMTDASFTSVTNYFGRYLNVIS